MADYYPVMARAVGELSANTEATRLSLYERARDALDAQLRRQTPPLSESDVARERRSLEDAIRRLERENAPDAGAALASAPPAAQSLPPARDRNDRLIASIKATLNDFETDELLRRYLENDRQAWSGEAFIAMREILLARGQTLPDQRKPITAEDHAGEKITPSAPPAVKITWQVKWANGQIRNYEKKEAVVDAIMAGEIQPECQCRQIKVRVKSGKISETKWRSVERSFDVYRPISRCMWRGGAIGTEVGITVAFLLRIIDSASGAFMLGSPQLAGMALMSVFLFLTALGTLADQISPALKGRVAKATAGLSNVLVIGVVLLTATMGYGVLLGVVLGLAGLGGVLIMGALFGGLPGLIIGTGVGVARRRAFKLPPGATVQSSGRMVAVGMLLPAACLALGLFLFVDYFIPFVIKGNIELFNSPLFKN